MAPSGSFHRQLEVILAVLSRSKQVSLGHAQPIVGPGYFADGIRTDGRRRYSATD